ncbi:MAG TPA: hypothetical protein VEU51_14920 [Candidatus Acidoferrales bacterium]|nr:hypothetical protein [Candidatus Acidoferrales bacterium]
MLSKWNRISVAVAAAFALILAAGVRGTFAQDVADPDPGSDWERVSPDTDSSGQVLELPQATCTQDGISVPCDDDGIPIAGGSPSSYDDDTASNDQPPPYTPDEVGTLDDYVNGGVYPMPYGFGAGMVATRGPIYVNRTPSPLPPSAYIVPPGASMSAPLTPAARPPLYPGGPWMTPPSMMTAPAGSPMASGPASFRLH